MELVRPRIGSAFRVATEHRLAHGSGDRLDTEARAEQAADDGRVRIGVSAALERHVKSVGVRRSAREMTKRVRETDLHEAVLRETIRRP